MSTNHMNELSLLEVAKKIVTEKGQMPLNKLINEAIEAKGQENNQSTYASLYLDIMVNGAFFFTTSKGVQMIDLKNRQSLSDLKTDEFVHDEDEEATKNELREENMDYAEGVDAALNQMKSDSEDDDEPDETDEIAEELGLVDPDIESEDEMVINIDEEEPEEFEEDLEDIKGEIKM